jgi:hypothetical protein
LARRRGISNLIYSLAGIHHKLGGYATIAGLRRVHAVPTFRRSGFAVRDEDVALAGAFAGRWAPVKQIDLIKNRAFIYTTRPDTRHTRIDYMDKQSGPGESWYYARVMQEDGQLAWSSPIWVRK